MKSKHSTPILAAAVLTGMLMFGPVITPNAQASNVPFTDINASSSAYQAIEWCADQHIIGGYNDGTFHPNDIVSEKSFCTMMQRAFDVPLTPKNPGNPITRYEVATLVSQITDKNQTSADTYDKQASAKTINDYLDIPKAYRDAVTNVHALGIMTGTSNGRFSGDSGITRAQAAAIIYRTAHLSDELALAATPRLANGKEITEKNVNEMITCLKAEYPGDKEFPGYTKLKTQAIADKNAIRDIVESYIVTGTKDDKCSTDTGCGGWAAFVIDYIFTQNANLRKIDISEIHPGDLMLRLDSAGRLEHVQVYIAPVKGMKPTQSVRITNANNGLGVPTAAGTTLYKILWTNASTKGHKFDIYTAYPE